MNERLIFIAAGAAAVIIMGIYYLKREHKLRSVMFGAITGIAALMLLNEFGSYIGAHVPLNAFNLGASAVLGVPYVIFLVIMKHL